MATAASRDSTGRPFRLDDYPGVVELFGPGVDHSEDADERDGQQEAGDARVPTARLPKPGDSYDVSTDMYYAPKFQSPLELTPYAETVIKDYLAFVDQHTPTASVWTDFQKSLGSYGHASRDEHDHVTYSWWHPYHYWTPIFIDNSRHTTYETPRHRPAAAEAVVDPISAQENPRPKKDELSAEKIAVVVAVVIGLIISVVVLTKLVVNYIRWGKQHARALDLCNLNLPATDQKFQMSEETWSLIASLQKLTQECRAIENDHLSIHRIISIASTIIVIVGLTLILFGALYTISPLLIAGCIVGGVGITAALSNWVVSPQAPKQDDLQKIRDAHTLANHNFRAWRSGAKPPYFDPNSREQLPRWKKGDLSYLTSLRDQLQIPQGPDGDARGKGIEENPYFATTYEEDPHTKQPSYTYCTYDSTYSPVPSAPPMDRADENFAAHTRGEGAAAPAAAPDVDLTQTDYDPSLPSEITIVSRIEGTTDKVNIIETITNQSQMRSSSFANGNTYNIDVFYHEQWRTVFFAPLKGRDQHLAFAYVE